MSAEYIFHVNTPIVLGGPMKHRLHFAFATTQADSVESLQRRLEERGSVYGLRLDTRPRDGKLHVYRRVATILTLDGVSMIADWTREDIVYDVEEEASSGS